MDVLLIEDSHDLADTLQMGLEQVGYRVDLAHDGVEGEVKARTSAYDLLVVDWMLPGQDGPVLLKRLRREGVAAPALMLTARAEHADEIEGLDAGADDYLTKPFSFEVLLARLRALSRRRPEEGARAPAEPALQLDAGPLRLDVRERTAAVGDAPLELREKEFKILTLLAEHPGRAFTRLQLAERVWGSMYASDDTINTTVSRLRRALQQAAADAGVTDLSIETLRGVGYRLRLSEGAK